MVWFRLKRVMLWCLLLFFLLLLLLHPSSLGSNRFNRLQHILCSTQHSKSAPLSIWYARIFAHPEHWFFFNQPTAKNTSRLLFGSPSAWHLLHLCQTCEFYVFNQRIDDRSVWVRLVRPLAAKAPKLIMTAVDFIFEPYKPLVKPMTAVCYVGSGRATIITIYFNIEIIQL